MAKLSLEKLIEGLVGLLVQADPSQIDHLLVAAKKRLTNQVADSRREELGHLFDAQLQVLADRGWPEAIVNMLREQRATVVAKALEIWNAKYFNESLADLANRGIHLFLPVTPRTYRTIYDQMPTVHNGENRGYTLLKPQAITDVVVTPPDPYYIFDVEDGRAMLGKAPQAAAKLFKGQGRRGLTDVEAVALGVLANVLAHHHVDAVGSRCGTGECPRLYLHDDAPKLDWYFLVSPSGRWGAASCE